MGADTLVTLYHACQREWETGRRHAGRAPLHFARG